MQKTEKKKDFMRQQDKKNIQLNLSGLHLQAFFEGGGDKDFKSGPKRFS